MTDREKVFVWLKHIGEVDPRCILEVVEACAGEHEARRYFVSRYNEIQEDKNV